MDYLSGNVQVEIKKNLTGNEQVKTTAKALVKATGQKVAQEAAEKEEKKDA